MRWYGRPKVTRVQLGKLSLRREHSGCVNTVADSGRNGRFYVDRRGSEGVKQLVKQTVCGLVMKLDGRRVRIM
jgi:hypothetical protein